MFGLTIEWNKRLIMQSIKCHKHSVRNLSRRDTFIPQLRRVAIKVPGLAGETVINPAGTLLWLSSGSYHTVRLVLNPLHYGSKAEPCVFL